MPDESMPPGSASAQDLLETMLPLVVQAASDSASSSAAAAASMARLEAEISKNTDQAAKCSQLREEELKLRKAELEFKKQQSQNAFDQSKNKMATIRGIFDSKLAIQVITILGSAFAIWSQMPSQEDLVPDPRYPSGEMRPALEPTPYPGP